MERRFLNSWSRCPLEVAILLGRCLEISWVVRPGKLVRCLRLIARKMVDLAGLKSDAWRYWANSETVLSRRITLLAMGVHAPYSLLL